MSELNNELINNFIEEFQDEETRHIYTEEFLNSKIATQIKALREQRGWTQSELAEKAGMKQERISALEDVNYAAWTLNVLRRLAKAFDLRIDLNFADFGSFLNEFTDFNRNSLERKSFKDDIAFKSKETQNNASAKIQNTINKAKPYKFGLIQGKDEPKPQQSLFRPQSIGNAKQVGKLSITESLENDSNEIKFQEMKIEENVSRNMPKLAFSTAKTA
jgi:transcriptional regulator with XRE-family HTH domain